MTNHVANPAIPETATSSASPRGEHPTVGIVMGSDSDWPVMQEAAAVLKEFGIEVEVGPGAAESRELNIGFFSR